MVVRVPGDYLDPLFAGLPERLTVEQLAAVLGVPVAVALRGLRQGAIPASKAGGAWVVYREDVRLLMRQAQTPRDS